MSINVDIATHDLATLRLLTKRENDEEAIIQAAREFIRMRRLQELMSISGKVDLQQNWQELEVLEFQEMDFPQ